MTLDALVVDECPVRRSQILKHVIPSLSSLLSFPSFRPILSCSSLLCKNLTHNPSGTKTCVLIENHVCFSCIYLILLDLVCSV
jgi:hypothetical protein